MSDAWDWAGGAIGDAGDALFGGGQDTGLLGTGHQRFNPYAIDQSSAQTQNGAYLTGEARQRLHDADMRQAPQMQAAQIGTMQNAQASGITNQNIGAIERANAAQTGTASQMGAASINRSEDQQVRAGQMTNLNQLGEAAAGRGPSLAGGMLREGNDRNNKQAMGAAASFKGQGNAALAQRGAMNTMAANNQQTNRDAAQMKIQEQQNAQAQYAGASANVRGQDASIAQAQAGFQQDAAGRNLDARNQFQLQQAAYQQQANLANQQAFNQRQLDQATLNQTGNQFNASATNQFALANMQANNDRTMQQALLDQQANTQNLGANMQTQAQKDAMAQYYFGTQVGMDQSDRQAAMQMQSMLANQDMGVMGLEKGAYDAAAQRKSAVGGGLLSSGAGLLGMAAMSDEDQKTGIKKLSDKELDEVYSVKPGASGASSSALASFGDIGADLGSAPASTPKSNNAGMQAAMAGAGGAGGGSLAGMAGGLGSGIGSAASNSMLGDVLGIGGGGGVSAMGGPANPSGEMKLKGGGLDVMGSLDSINGGIRNAQSNPIAQPSGMGRFGSFGGGMTGVAMSDQDQKQQVSAVDAQAQRDLSKVGAYKYRYKDPSKPGAGEGEHVSPMAQELEETELFRNAVIDTPDGKMVDYGKGFGAMLAGMSMMNRRLDRVEKKGKR